MYRPMLSTIAREALTAFCFPPQPFVRQSGCT